MEKSISITYDIEHRYTKVILGSEDEEKEAKNRQFTSFHHLTMDDSMMMFMMGVPHYAHTHLHIKCHC